VDGGNQPVSGQEKLTLLKGGSKATRSEKPRGRNGKWVAYVLVVLITLLQILFPQGAGGSAKREVSESIVIGVMLFGDRPRRE
jgi:hypothetical protein